MWVKRIIILLSLAFVGGANAASLQQLAADNDVSTAYRFIQQGGKVDAIDKHGLTALHVAGAKGSDDFAQFLLNNGADVNKGDNYGRTPLMHAVANNKLNTARILLRAGANPAIKDTTSQDTFAYANADRNYQALELLQKYSGVAVSKLPAPVVQKAAATQVDNSFADRVLEDQVEEAKDISSKILSRADEEAARRLSSAKYEAKQILREAQRAKENKLSSLDSIYAQKRNAANDEARVIIEQAKIKAQSILDAARSEASIGAESLRREIEEEIKASKYKQIARAEMEANKIIENAQKQANEIIKQSELSRQKAFSDAARTLAESEIKASRIEEKVSQKQAEAHLESSTIIANAKSEADKIINSAKLVLDNQSSAHKVRLRQIEEQAKELSNSMITNAKLKSQKISDEANLVFSKAQADANEILAQTQDKAHQIAKKIIDDAQNQSGDIIGAAERSIAEKEAAFRSRLENLIVKEQNMQQRIKIADTKLKTVEQQLITMQHEYRRELFAQVEEQAKERWELVEQDIKKQRDDVKKESEQILSSASKDSQQMVSSAAERSKKQIKQAQEEASNILSNAQRTAEQLVSRAKDESQDIISRTQREMGVVEKNSMMKISQLNESARLKIKQQISNLENRVLELDAREVALKKLQQQIEQQSKIINQQARAIKNSEGDSAIAAVLNSEILDESLSSHKPTDYSDIIIDEDGKELAVSVLEDEIFGNNPVTLNVVNVGSASQPNDNEEDLSALEKEFSKKIMGKFADFNLLEATNTALMEKPDDNENGQGGLYIMEENEVISFLGNTEPYDATKDTTIVVTDSQELTSLGNDYSDVEGSMSAESGLIESYKYWVSLSGFNDEDKAMSHYKKVADAKIEALEYDFEESPLENGVTLKLGPVDSISQVSELCEKFKKPNIACSAIAQ